jgi:Cys-tRNA(Pro)/Cys-tRNA(Cys) deacylase
LDLEGFLKENKLWYRMIDKPETVHTVDAAKTTKIELRRITKNLVAETDEGEYVMLIVPGDKKVNLKEAAVSLRVRSIRLVPFNKAEEISGYPPGGTPSVGHKTKMRTVVDESILRYETVYCGGGSRYRLLELRTADITRLTGAIIQKVSE